MPLYTLPAMIVAILVVVPFWRLLPQFGISPYFAVLALFPPLAIVLLWIMAFKDSGSGRSA